MTTLRVVVEGRPRAWSRPWTAGGPSKSERATEQLKALTDHLWTARHGAGWIPGLPAELRLTFFFGPRGTQGCTLIEISQPPIAAPVPGHVYRAVSPDIDNLSKLVLEACQHSGVLLDDKQVVRLVAQKVDR